MEGEVGVLGIVGRIEADVYYGDGKASGVEDVCKLKHGAYVALQRHREKNHPAARPFLHGPVALSSDVLHAASFLLFASQLSTLKDLNRERRLSISNNFENRTT